MTTESTPKTRAELKGYFVNNAIPTEAQFHALIDSSLNCTDVVIVKRPNKPLGIEATVSAAGAQKLINFYADLKDTDTDPAWTLQLNPRLDVNKPETAKAGLSISDGQGASRLFIDSATGRVGIGTTEPSQTLEVNGNIKVSGTIDASDISLPYGNYDIELQGTAYAKDVLVTTDKGTTFLKIANVDMGMKSDRGLNTIILNPDGTLKIQRSFDVWNDRSQWNSWADWVKANASIGDIVAVASFDAVRSVPENGSAAKIFTSVNARGPYTELAGTNFDERVPYALIFAMGGQAKEVLSTPYGPSAKLTTTYYDLASRDRVSSSALLQNLVPRGLISMWSGNSVPNGWALCDGNNGTPDLRDRFIVGSGAKYKNGEKGGQDSVALTIDQMPSHNHANNQFKYMLQFSGDHTLKDWDKNHNEPSLLKMGEILPAGGNQAHENRPPYYALSFIMKL